MVSYRFITSTDISPGMLPEINSLLSQLAPDSPKVTLEALRQTADKSHLLLVSDSDTGKIVGLAVLTVAHKLVTPDFGSIEDVVVDSAYRGKGIGKEIVSQLISKARQLKLHYIELTSNPSRVTANRLYQSLDFVLRPTNCYRLQL